MRLRYTRAALADLDSILDYVARRSPQGAASIRSRINAIVDLLVSQPQSGVQTENPKLRRATCSPYPYLVFYEIRKDEIIIHAIRHSARDPSSMPGHE